MGRRRLRLGRLLRGTVSLVSIEMERRTMSTVTETRATPEDLYRVEGKAELIGGRIVILMPNGLWPGDVGYNLCRSLKDHAKRIGRGRGTCDGVGYNIPELPSGRESFCPDAAYFAGEVPGKSMRFITGPPTFAAEVRSEGDYGPAAERDMAAKRADYFAAGTLVVWDVDPTAETVHSYRPEAPERPVTFRQGETADAEPAVPGWRIAVAEVFAE